MNYSEQTDDILVSLSLTGNEKAYEELVIRYQKAVINSAYSITRNWYLAEDAAQDAFVSAWIKLDHLRESSKYAAWVCRISRNCAKNLAVRYREYIDYDLIANSEHEHNESEFTDVIAYDNSSNDDLNDSINTLSEKVKTVIVMHYYEGLSIDEIADRLRVPIGTVKWRLHEGREKIRKEYGVTEDMDNLTLVEKVMKKVNELKNWRLYDNKSGFEAEYNDVLKDIDSLPESADKYYAMADVMMMGYWWLDDKKNDELLVQLYDAAVKGNNEDVIGEIITAEDNKLSGKEKIAFMRDKQIPKLEEGGYTKALGKEWFWLGYEYINTENDFESGLAAFNKVLEILEPSDVYYANAIAALHIEKSVEGFNLRFLQAGARGEHYKIIDGKLRYWMQPGYSIGFMQDVSINDIVFLFAAFCDNLFYDSDMNVGSVYKGTNEKSTLTFAADNVTADTACGVFDGCELWISDTFRWGRNYIVKTYYKRNIGIVRSEVIIDGRLDVNVLKKYTINGGEGLIPFAVGNRWEYETLGYPKGIDSENIYEVTSFDGVNVILWNSSYDHRVKYDENSWEEMIMNARNGYVRFLDRTGNREELADVSYPMSRAEELAVTPIQKAHTKSANSVMRRILDTDTNFNPNATAKGHWNFFNYNEISKSCDKFILYDNRERSFEWKQFDGNGGNMLLNNIYSIFDEALGCLWSDEWAVGYTSTSENIVYGMKITTDIKVSKADTITTAAGTFDDCIMIEIKPTPKEDSEAWNGWRYRMYKTDYYFANGIGIVKVVTHYDNPNKDICVYHLTSYTGTGEGYMPLEHGLTRRFDCMSLKDGYFAWSDYVYCNDDNGKLIILEDRAGIKNL